MTFLVGDWGTKENFWAEKIEVETFFLNSLNDKKLNIF